MESGLSAGREGGKCRCGTRRAVKKWARLEDTAIGCVQLTFRQTRRKSRAGRIIGLSASGRCRPANNCSAHGNTTAGCLQSNSRQMDALASPLRLRSFFGSSTTVARATTLSSTSQSKSPPHTTTPSPGRAMTNTSLQYLLARSSVSTRPLARRFLNGPFTATNTTGSGPGGRGNEHLRTKSFKVSDH